MDCKYKYIFAMITGLFSLVLLKTIHLISMDVPIVEYAKQTAVESPPFLRSAAEFQPTNVSLHNGSTGADNSTSRSQFPVTNASRNQQRGINQTEIYDASGMTVATQSGFHISNPNKTYHVCDKLDVIIEARDVKRNRKSYGGDYFRARIFNAALKAGQSPDADAEYIGDGRYKVSFTLRWVGETFVRVILVQSAEAASVLRRVSKDIPSRNGYVGKFVQTTGNKTIEEVTFCNVVPPGDDGDICDLARKNGEPWFCFKPPTLNCSDFSAMAGHRAHSAEILKNALKPGENILFPKKKLPVSAEGIVMIHANKSEATPDACSRAPLPSCQVGCHNMTSPIAAGYFLKNKWFSNHCRLRNFNQAASGKCLKNKTIYFQGDSTIRQYYEYIANTFKKSVKNIPLIPPVHPKVGPLHAEDKLNNFTMHYRHHGYPIRIIWTNDSRVKYIEEALDELSATRDTVFVFTLWAHLTTVTVEFYERRARQIRAAIERLHKRSPETLVILKSANTCMGPPLQVTDWFSREIDLKMREVFSDYKNIGFIDQWSVTEGFSNSDKLHPTKTVIAGGVDTLLSYMCPN